MNSKKLFGRVAFASLVAVLAVVPVASHLIPTVRAQGAPYHVHLTFARGEGNERVMHVTWFTTGSAPTEVQWGTASGSYAESATGTSAYRSHLGKHVHEANLTGLQPNTRYYYRVGSDEGGWSTERTFLSAHDVNTAAAAGSFKFVAYGDTRTNAADRREVLDAILWEVQNNDVRFVLHDGDIIESNDDLGEWNDWFSDSEAVASRVPLMTVEGNHDLGGDYWGAQYYNPQNGPLMGATLRERDYTYWFVYANAFFVNLDYDFDYGNPSGADYAWLGSVLDHANQLRSQGLVHWIVMLWHSPPYNSGVSHGEDRTIQDNLCPFIEARGVDVAFNGHDHIWERQYQLSSPGGHVVNDDSVITQDVNEPVPGTVYVVAGGGGAPRVPQFCVLDQQDYSADYACENSYALVTVNLDYQTGQTSLRIQGRDGSHGTLDSGVTLIKTGITAPGPPAPPETPPWWVGLGVAGAVAGGVGSYYGLRRLKRKLELRRLGVPGAAA
ncbi:MAG: hypothetical protein Kow0069_10050 [Promethearchaeota archaeon]